MLDDAIVADYVAAVAGLVGDGPRELRIVHTAMHGVGTELSRSGVRRGRLRAA